MAPPTGEASEADETAGVVVSVAVCTAAAVGARVLTGSTSGWLGGLCELVLVLAGGFLAYLMFVFGLYAVVVRMIDRHASQRPVGVRDRVRVTGVLVGGAVVASWALTAWLSGYDATQWRWSGGSVLTAVVILAIVTARVRGGAGPDGPVSPDGPEEPRHRRSEGAP